MPVIKAFLKRSQSSGGFFLALSHGVLLPHPALTPILFPHLVEDKVKDQLEAAKPEPIIDEVDLANLAPRKPDWDLKRDVAKKLEKLEKRTQRAIAELIRERLKGQEEELASAVGSAKQDGSDSD
nr:PREDICTED: coiled-coil domain-containing protein 12-like [Apteryx mantelli mantelli]